MGAADVGSYRPDISRRHPIPQLRVLLVGHRYPPDGSGGYELHCEAVRRHLLAEGHHVEVLVARHGRAVADPGVHQDLRWWPPGRRASAAAAWRFERHNVRVLERHLDRVRPHVVGWWRLGETSLSLLEVVRRRAIPAVGVVGDGWMWEGARRDPWRRRLPGRALAPPVAWAAAARWVFVSAWLLAQAHRHGIDPGDAAVRPAGVDTALFRPRPVAPPWSGRLLYAGRISPHKGVDSAIDALAQLPGHALSVIGDGAPAEMARLRRRAAALGVAARVAFEPALPRSALAARYRAADAVLFPVRWDEPFGLVPLEAMASGTPVVATGTGGSAEYLRDGDNALLVAPGAPAALAGAVRRLEDASGLRERLAAGGLRTVARHDAASADRFVAEQYRRAAGRSRPSGG